MVAICFFIFAGVWKVGVKSKGLGLSLTMGKSCLLRSVDHWHAKFRFAVSHVRHLAYYLCMCGGIVGPVCYMRLFFFVSDPRLLGPCVPDQPCTVAFAL